ncbi:MAG: hypothetical protein GHCLOJNM_01159 [bacterium]|nr:hypothetical protein [bacterium]
MAVLQTKRERLLMGLTALAVVFGGGYLFVFRPVIAMYRDLDSEIAKAREQYAAAKDKYIRSKQIRAEFEHIRESLSLEGTEQKKQEQINSELTRLVDENHILPHQQSPSSGENIDDFKIYSFDLKTIETDWPTLAAFLYAVENTPAVLEVQSLTVAKNPGRNLPPNKTIKVDIRISRLIEHKLARTERRGRRR